MASLFVSHSSHNRDEAERVAQRLRVEGFAALFLDFDPADGIPAGRDWERELYAQLRKTDGVVFLASAPSVASQWCFTEIGLARSLGKPVFPVRLNTDVKLPLLDDMQWVDLGEGELAFARLLVGLRVAGLDASKGFAWDPMRKLWTRPIQRAAAPQADEERRARPRPDRPIAHRQVAGA